MRISPLIRRVAGSLALAGALTANAPNALAVDLPDMGDSSGAVVSPYEEKQLGEAFMREVRRSLRLISDPMVNDYAQNLGTKLTSHLRDSNTGYTFFVVESPVINAFAAPGGFIGLHTGLILSAQTEDELAGVVAHEIAHVAQRHLPRAIEQGSKLSIPTTAALIAALILGQGNSQVTEAALATTLAGHQQARINFTRGNEQEADRIGMELLADASFDPRGMPAFFEKLQQAYRFYDNNLPEFLSTHPVTTSRISDSRARAELYPAPPPPPYSNFPFVQARLRVLTAPSATEAVEFFAAGLNKGNDENRLVARYGYVLALTRAGDTRTARKFVTELLDEDPERIIYVLAAAEVESADRNFATAIQMLDDALALFPHQHSLTMALGESLLNDGQTDRARKLLREHIKSRDQDPAVYKLYARAAGEAGYEIDAHMALAEQHYLMGETHTALQQLTLAKALVDKQPNKERFFYESSRIEARMQQLTTELAEQKK